ncbi:hypothetical protein H632_c225p1 [Helicosporidium sp. ATCC 50920]|nr:hypothetical protein H632_c225p1 [Helicosporidium sp. ATCC 50920]|eukprot:KDD76440.1 hypothetical protein H632_c225p1 [Helicosporidium sp. ATCC 50920]
MADLDAEFARFHAELAAVSAEQPADEVRDVGSEASAVAPSLNPTPLPRLAPAPAPKPASFAHGAPPGPYALSGRGLAGPEPKMKVAAVREAAGQRWVDSTLAEWPENDFRIFVGNLGNEVSDTVLQSAFQIYPSFQKSRIVRSGHNAKSKGYGFVSFGDPVEGARAMREMQGKYIGNRPVQLKKSTWDDRQVVDKRTGGAFKKLVVDKEKRPSKRQRLAEQNPSGYAPGGNTQQYYSRRH